jgi:hypothetical protein
LGKGTVELLARAGGWRPETFLRDGKEPVAVLFRALAAHGRGSASAARQALAEARKLLVPEKIDLVEQTPLPWPQRVESDVLVKKVEALLAAPAK